MSDAKVSGDSHGSTELSFMPGRIRGGDFHFDIGTAGSVSLVLQTLLPALFALKQKSALTLVGGTHVPLIIRWPGVVRAGEVRDDPSTALDMNATSLHAAGIAVPPGYHGRPLRRVVEENLVLDLQTPQLLIEEVQFFVYGHRKVPPTD